MSDWKFELAYSQDQRRITELTSASNRNLTMALNRPGSFSFAMPLADDIAPIITEGSTCVLAEFQGERVWGGPVWTTQEDAGGSDTLQVGCVGWAQTLEKRQVRPAWNNNAAVNYSEVEAGAIIQDLVRRTNDDATNAGGPSFVFPGIYETTQIRTRTYQPWTPILPSIVELANVESGVDFEVDPYTRELNVYSNIGEDTGVAFNLGANVRSVQRQTDISRTRNYFTAFGPPGMATSEDPTSVADIGLFEESQALSDVTNFSVLETFAAAEVGVHGRPLPVITFTPMPYSAERDFDPRPMRDYRVGDIVKLNAQKGRMDIRNQSIRVFSISITFVGESEVVGGIQGTYS